MWIVYEATPECPARIRLVTTNKTNALAYRNACTLAEDPYWTVEICEVDLEKPCDVILHFGERRAEVERL